MKITYNVVFNFHRIFIPSNRLFGAILKSNEIVSSQQPFIQLGNHMTTASNKSPGFHLPILHGVLPIKGAQIPAELIAGITLTALAVPQVIGYAKICGMPVITGLYAILLPAALFALFGSSRHLVVSADSATAAILAAGMVGLADIGSDQYVALAAVLAFMAAEFLSRTVVTGFLTGVGVQVALGQISSMLGLKDGRHGTVQKIWNDFLRSNRSTSTRWPLLSVCWWSLSVPRKFRRKYREH
jgi:MFS superfamily sulfate permease-like transporter